MKKQNYIFIFLSIIGFSTICKAQICDFRMGYDLYFASAKMHWNSSDYTGTVDDFDAVGISISISTRIRNNLYIRTSLGTLRSRAFFSYTNTKSDPFKIYVGTLDIDELCMEPLIEYRTPLFRKFHWFINGGFSVNYVLDHNEAISSKKWRMGALINSGLIWNFNKNIAISFDGGFRNNLLVQSEAVKPTVSFNVVRLGLSIHYWI